MSHIWMSHVTCMNESCHIYEWVMSHMNESCHTYEWVMSHIWMSHNTPPKDIARPSEKSKTPRSCGWKSVSKNNTWLGYDMTRSFVTCSAGWRRLIGCLKLQVTFCKRATNNRALLREMTCKDKASYGSSPPCKNKSTRSLFKYNIKRGTYVNHSRFWYFHCNNYFESHLLGNGLYRQFCRDDGVRGLCVLQCVGACCSVWQCGKDNGVVIARRLSAWFVRVAVRVSVLQCVAAW